VDGDVLFILAGNDLNDAAGADRRTLFTGQAFFVKVLACMQELSAAR
jgi:hypothetical protein